jgi:hypothetical protein
MSWMIFFRMKNLSHYWGVPGATCRQFENPQNKTAIMQGIQETTKQLKERMVRQGGVIFLSGLLSERPEIFTDFFP